MKKQILVILGHPDTDSLCGALAQSYIDGAVSAGHDVRVLRLGDMAFDPILHLGYRKVQELEPDLVAAQEAIRWAQHLVFVYPNWWGAMPALLKGFIDRVFLPGFAFKYRRPDSLMWDKLLTGRSAHLLVTMDTPPWYYRFVFRAPGHNQMKRTILEFCGVRPVKISNFGPVKTGNAQEREKYLLRAFAFGNKA